MNSTENGDASEGSEVPAPLVTPVVLLLKTRTSYDMGIVLNCLRL